MMAKQISVTGIVQGVGFRPFVYGLAHRLALHGWVRNTAAGVEILVEGQKVSLDEFIQRLTTEAPPLARIDSIDIQQVTTETELAAFDIQPTAAGLAAYQPISPDVAICPDCERELFDPQNRRYLHPFINCTNCGPRFTIIRDMPYDRGQTTLSEFEMCPACRDEYENPADRRFHAQPVACSRCGPFVELRENQTRGKGGTPKISTIECRTSAILKARRLLRKGQILAIKGLGGFHLACDAANPSAVAELRRRKGRIDKPFAVMAASLAVVDAICKADARERELLAGREKPVVLLPRRALKGSDNRVVCEAVAPNLDTLGVMLPYTPLHHLLLNQDDPELGREPAPEVLVMTSGNLSEEPIATDNLEALQRLAPLADAFLLHNREIHVRCDDSVVRADREGVLFLRRSRGYAPSPLALPVAVAPTLAVGGELKNTFCVARDQRAFLSQHIGDLENAETLDSFERGVAHFTRIFRVQPSLLAHDLHPNYLTTRYALRSEAAIRRVAVQHHHAHIAACLADNGLDDRRVIGLAFDGTGYGTDGAIWGGEALVASYAGFDRLAHLEYLPLPGGDAAIRHPWRIAVAYAHALGLDIADRPFLGQLEKQAVEIVRQQVDKKLNAPLTSSLGRLFDAVAALIGLRGDVTYEAQAAVEMEVLARPFVFMVRPYPFFIEETSAGLIIRVQGLLGGVIKSLRSHEAAEMVAARFHRTIADMAIGVCKYARARTDLNEVALSGGVWQNQVLLHLVRSGLQQEGFTCYFHQQVPTNDGGLALGQVLIANAVVGAGQPPAPTQ